MATYTEQLQQIVTKYVEAGEEWPATSRQIAAWGVGEGLWRPHPSSIVSQCAEALSNAMRDEHIVDPQGRTVRAKHAARIKQEVLWADIRTAPRQHLEIAFKQRRRAILGDCRQLNLDVDSFNENRAPKNPIQLIFDFTNDLLEMDALDKALANVA